MAEHSPRLLAADVAACIGFYTRLPTMGLDRETSFAGAQWATPVVGAVVGLIGGLACWVAMALDLPAEIAAVAALGAPMLATGCLHEDGLSDVADGFGGGRDREAKLDIMRDSRIGTYGVAALTLVILARWSAIAALASSDHVLPALIAAHAGSRALFPAFMRTVPPARQDGLSAGVGLIPSSAATVAMAIGAIIALPCLGFAATLVAAVALAIWFFGLEALTRRQIGGQTGDVLGTLQQGGEVILLAVACAVLI